MQESHIKKNQEISLKLKTLSISKKHDILLLTRIALLSFHTRKSIPQAVTFERNTVELSREAGLSHIQKQN